MKYILVLDQGTTSTRAIIFDQNTNVVAKAQEEFPQIYPKPGYVEHDPIDILSTSRSVISSALARAKIKYSEVVTMGITNQRETVVLWNKTTGEVVYNAIVWQCRRTQDFCEELIKAGKEKLIYDKTGLKIDPYFSASKIKWVIDNIPLAKELLDSNNLCVGTIDTYLMWSLSGNKIYKTDYTNASRTMLFNIHTLSWDDELCQLFNIPKSILPQVHPSGHMYGYTSEDILGCKIPICGVAGDQQSSLFGQLCLNESDLKVTYGTGCFLLMNTANKPIISNNGLITTLACSLTNSPIYALEGSVFVGGALIQWIRDELELIESASETEEIALSVNDSNNVVIVPAFVGLGAPYWDFKATGIITGLTRGVNKRHIVRASLEAIAYQVFDVVDSMSKDFNKKITNIKVDGGACINNFLMQFQSDILNMKITRPKDIEVTALGACYLAGLTAKIWRDIDEIKNLNKIDTIFTPKMESQKKEELLKLWHDSVNKTITK